VEKKTLWKISECETALLKKITPEYVEKALEQMEAKIHSDIANNRSQQLNELKFSLETQKARLETVSRNVEEYEKENKALIKDLQ
jgi:multidrug resistance efflux pump